MSSKDLGIEVIIDRRTGEVLLSRDKEVMLKIAEDINPDELDQFKTFYDSKPASAEGDLDYPSFCG